MEFCTRFRIEFRTPVHFGVDAEEFSVRDIRRETIRGKVKDESTLFG